jgi:hypothetical protein
VAAYVVLFTGSRDLEDRAAVDADLDDLDATHEHLCLRVGDCKTGLDLFVREWAQRRWLAQWRLRCRVYKARWDVFGDAAGPKRNQRMVNDGADEAHAWFAPPPALNKGTTGCVKLARAAGIKVVEYGRETPTTETYEQETLPL